MKKVVIPLLVLIACIGIYSVFTSNNKDEGHYSNGDSIICRVDGCGKRPVYSDWNNRFCEEHLNKSEDHASQYAPRVATKKINTEHALTKDEADALSGTGYHGTRPNSAAEDIELKAAMVKCKKCGMHSDNGANSLCDKCRYNEEHGLD